MIIISNILVIIILDIVAILIENKEVVVPHGSYLNEVEIYLKGTSVFTSVHI